MDDQAMFSLNNLMNNQDFNFLDQLSKSELFNIRPNDDLINDSPYANIQLQCKYLDETEFANCFSNLNSFSYMSFNIQSLQAKFNLFQEMIQHFIDSGCAPDDILLQEIWKIPDVSLFELNGYSFLYKSRNISQGGSVGFYIKTEYRYNVLQAFSTFHDRIFESLFIEIWLNKNKKIIKGNVNRPAVNHPVLSTSEQFSEFFDIFSNTRLIISTKYSHNNRWRF